MRAKVTESTAVRLVLGLVLLAMLALTPLLAQTGANTGLQGRVTDPSGGAIPGVTVTVTRAETGEVRTVVTDDTGDWEVRALTAGPYTVSLEMTGFKKFIQSGVNVTTSEMATVNVTMQLGEIGQTVEVTSDAEMVSSTSATVIKTLDKRELEALPTSSRNFTQLLVIEPGVSADISELLSNDNASISPSVNGARTTNNSFVYNGIDVTNLLCCNDVTGGSGGSLSRNMAPAPETLEEVKLQTSLFDA
ncbi:MAG: carboxypeptidase regulatory-like domain-containing protein, partial [Acidobacteria bacterium]